MRHRKYSLKHGTKNMRRLTIQAMHKIVRDEIPAYAGNWQKMHGKMPRRHKTLKKCYKRRKQRLELGKDVRNAIKGVLGIHSPSKYLSDAANINRNCDPCDYDLVYAIDTLIGYFAAMGISIADIEKELGYRIDIIKNSTSKKIKTDSRKEI